MKINRFYVCLFLVLALSGFAFAEDETFLLNEEYADNLYLTTNNIEINSNLYGDLYAISDIIIINALVRDDINAIAETFVLEGTVGSDIRIISSSVTVHGTVFGELMILGNTVSLSDSSAVGGAVKINANVVEINGTLKDDLNINAEKVILNGIVEGDVIIRASTFELGPQARILGDLSSSKDISEVSSQVDGTVTKTEGKENPDSFTSMTFGKIGMFLAIFLIGAALVFITPKYTERAVKSASGRFLLSLAIGFLVLVATPFAVIFIALTVVGIPIAILLGILYVATIILAFGLSAVLVGRAGIRLFKGKRGLWIQLLIGSLALALISIVPPIFWVLMLVLLLTSIGAFILGLRKDRKNK